MMNQKQRDHFIDRVKEKCKDKINSLKAKHAAEIQNLADICILVESAIMIESLAF